MAIVALIGYIEGKFQIVPHLFRIANLDVVVNHLLVAHKEIIEISHLEAISTRLKMFRPLFHIHRSGYNGGP